MRLLIFALLSVAKAKLELDSPPEDTEARENFGPIDFQPPPPPPEIDHPAPDAFEKPSDQAAQDPPFPQYSEQFTVETAEYNAAGEQVVSQHIYWDLTARRTHMKAEGPLVGGGAFEQIMRCDIPVKGWFVEATSPTPDNISTWACTNTTVNSDPEYCQLGEFWVSPRFSLYEGTEVIDGVECGRWIYRSRSSGNKYVFWGNTEAPCASGEIDSSDSSKLVWQLVFSNFVSGAPDFPADFEVTDGVTCPSATKYVSNSQWWDPSLDESAEYLLKEGLWHARGKEHFRDLNFR